MNWFEKINETYYNIGYIAVVIIVGILAVVCGFATAEVLLGILLKSATFTVSSLILVKAMMGPGVDVKKEILEQNNGALGTFMAGLLIGLGCAIGGM